MTSAETLSRVGLSAKAIDRVENSNREIRKILNDLDRETKGITAEKLSMRSPNFATPCLYVRALEED
jgi:hypothetical protein